MISKATLKAYDWTVIESYYDYVIESRINGQHAQVKNLIKDMSKKQQLEFITYVNDIELNADPYVTIILED